ncbi:MAG: hypothetical protein EOM19_03015 [Candidatus Moranbacteria bacterium]|nr:hypothetical protein [Candidatus Moranbacteria bacterium]
MNKLKIKKGNYIANFRTHILVGGGLGMLGAISCSTLELLDKPEMLALLFFVIVLASTLPDIDSDSGIPFHIIFGSFSFFIVLQIFVFLEENVFYERIILALIGGFFMWVFGGSLFKRFTRHRGMAHSIPAVMLCGLGIFFVASSFSFSDKESFLLAIFGMIGYLSHLILDEAYALVDFRGNHFSPKRSLGSALKLFSLSKRKNFIMYGLIIFLLMGNIFRFQELSQTLWDQFF